MRDGGESADVQCTRKKMIPMVLLTATIVLAALIVSRHREPPVSGLEGRTQELWDGAKLYAADS